MHCQIAPQEFTIGDLKRFWRALDFQILVRNWVFLSFVNHLWDGDVEGWMKDIVLDTIGVVNLFYSWQTQWLECELVLCINPRRGQGAGRSVGVRGGGGGGVEGVPQQETHQRPLGCHSYTFSFPLIRLKLSSSENISSVSKYAQHTQSNV